MARKDVVDEEQDNSIDQVEELYEAAMADIYDIIMDAYDKIGVRVHDLVSDVESGVGEEENKDE